VINHKKFHQDISVSSKVIQQFVFQRHISKPKLDHLMGTVPRIRPIFALLEGRWKTKWSQAGVCWRLFNPSKWEADIWGWLEVRRSAMLHYTVNQHPHWACWQYGHSGRTRGWVGVERWQLCLHCKCFVCWIHRWMSANQIRKQQTVILTD
jgi:hypothetical protein